VKYKVKGTVILDGCLREKRLTRKDVPTLFKINDDQYGELLEHCARKSYSFHSSTEGAILSELESIAKVYFKK
jgi:hypothetical protein